MENYASTLYLYSVEGKYDFILSYPLVFLSQVFLSRIHIFHISRMNLIPQLGSYSLFLHYSRFGGVEKRKLLHEFFFFISFHSSQVKTKNEKKI